MARKISFDFFRKLPAHEKKITPSTILTLFRIVLTPVIVVLMINALWGAAFFCFISAAVSDMLDGNLARWRNEKTFLGACLDPVADKILVLSVFFTLAFVHTPLFTLPTGFVFFVLFKEIALIVGAGVFYQVCGYLYINPTVLGKMTTVTQMSFIMWLFACYFFRWMPVKTYYTMLGVVIIMVFSSLAQYTCIGLRLFYAKKT